MVNLCIVIVEPSWVVNLSAEKDDVVLLWARDRPFPVEPGEIIAFKLRGDLDICGCAIVRRCLSEDIDAVWDRYGVTTAAKTRVELMGLIAGMRQSDVIGASTEIGLMVLGQPAFFDKGLPRPGLPSSWHPSTAISRRFSTDTGEGSELWQNLVERVDFALLENDLGPGVQPGFGERRYGSPVILRPRIGQREFSHQMGVAYDDRCAVTRERVGWHAAHMKAYASDGPHRTSNGLPLRCDLHWAFDNGFLTITEALTVVVSDQLEKEYGEVSIVRYHGQPIYRPQHLIDRPDPEMIRWHHANVFEKWAGGRRKRR